MNDVTYWNGELAPARRVTLVVADAPQFPLYWARDAVGTTRDAVEVAYDGETFYLDDEFGQGWGKVTAGHGSPRLSHRNLQAEPGSVAAR